MTFISIFQIITALSCVIKYFTLSQPNDEVKLHVELICLEEGAFNQAVWVKTDVPFSFFVSWTASRPYLEVIHQNATDDFTLINFPRTYFGTRMFQSMVLRNVSSEKLIYAIVAVLDQNDIVNHYNYCY